MRNPLTALQPGLNPFEVLGAEESDSLATIEERAEEVEARVAAGLLDPRLGLKPGDAWSAAEQLRSPVTRLYFAAAWFGRDASIGGADDDGNRD